MSKKEYRSIWKKRERDARRARLSAIEKAKHIAKVLKEKYHAKESILFGSLLWRPDFLWSGTDIDMMVMGLDRNDYFKILAEVSEMARPFEIDLIPFEKAEESIKRRAIKEGLRLE